ncbi:hypothetical protein E2493_02475 [Sphingomonas parva]|uniref:Peptidase S8/S53 domain-containing protein n=1 Tax=Sphingomonas parva TaxID=2555898 RepID=A0A4Y8ZUN7_9SPHN|nr:S8 family serine peptidase [Sphingomonas parva]TFI59730.1 hypothetical protein E2493_02475 [Sphingomonas parva]
MRYRIKAYTLDSKTRELAREAVDEGLIEEPEITSGFVQGTCGEAGIRRLSESGLTVRALAPIPEEGTGFKSATPSGGRSGGAPGLSGASGPGAAPASAREQPGHYLMTLRGSVTRDLRERLSDAGVTLLERDEGGRYVARVAEGLGRLRDHPDVEDIQHYGVRQTLEAGRAPTQNASFATASVAAGLGEASVLEAVVHPGFDSDALAEALSADGAEVMATTRRVIRFTLGRARLEDIAAKEEIAEIQAPGVAGLLHDVVRPLVGLADQAGGHRSVPYKGEGEVVGIADSGLDQEHPDFRGRIRKVVARGRPGDPSDLHGHGTHVTGTVAGDGSASDGALAGIAPATEIVFQSLMDAQGGLGGLPLVLGDLFQEAYDEGVRIHNNSWGAFLHGRYTSMSYDVDRFVHEHPDFLPVIAAGNDASCNPGANVINQPGFVDWPSMSAPASAKNGLTVGASRSSRTDLGLAKLTYAQAWPKSFKVPGIGEEPVSGDPECLAGFSGRGPCDDMRVKPDVVAPGTDVASTRGARTPLRNFWGPYPHNPYYAVMGGTSMACPVVTGLAVLVRQYFRRERGHGNPSAALLKAAIINGTRPLSGRDAIADPGGRPSYHQGFGRVDISSTVPDPAAPTFALSFQDQDASGSPLVDTGDYVRFAFQVEAKGDIRLCLVWTDIPGRALQNALLMQLEDSSTNTWNSNGDLYAHVEMPVPDPLATIPGLLKRDPNNNVHVIRVDDAEPGEYFVSILADNLLAGPQGFALVVAGPVSDLARLG